jgi:hypothetical protein
MAMFAASMEGGRIYNKLNWMDEKRESQKCLVTAKETNYDARITE